MKTISRNLLLLAMAWAMASCAHRWSRELPATHPNAKQVYERLHEIIIPRVDWVDVTVIDAVNSLSELSRRGSWGVSVVVGGGTAIGSDSGNGNKPKEPKVTIRGNSMRYLDVIEGICKQADLFWWIDSKALVVASKEAYERSVAPAARK